MKLNLPTNVETEERPRLSAQPKRPFNEPEVSVPYDVLETTKFFFIADSSNFFGGEGEI